MSTTSFAVPVLPGQDARSVPAYFRDHLAEYEDSRDNAGVTLERVYFQPTPMGDFVVAYIESREDFGVATLKMATSGKEIDRFFVNALREIHGFDLTQPPPGPPPELVGAWSDPDVTERRPGMAFCAPLIPGQTDAGRAFAKEAYETRGGDLAESRRAVGQSAETVFLNTTPQGDVICVYIEATDPRAANAALAASDRPYDLWFKSQLKTIFPPFVDFDQPVPPVEQIWDWQRVAARV
ncbi:MAG TPA: hypothetical protein VG245_10920 [Candidatus Dormibacteraeota bacterium]|nr:hypothetical protein [Candidatus Dormibacteraeota bacterium]